MYQSSKTKLDALNEVLGLLDLSTVITSTDTHASRTTLTIMKQTLTLLLNQADWLELVGDTYLKELTPIISPGVMSGLLGFQFPYSSRVQRVLNTEQDRELCYMRPSTFETNPLNADPFPVTTDITFITTDSTLYTSDITGGDNHVMYYTMHYNAVFLPPTTNWYKYKVIHTKPFTIPANDLDYFEAPDYLVDLLVLGTAYRYASMYSPARNDTAAARVSGLRMMYEESLRTIRNSKLNRPVNARSSVI